MSLYFKYLKVHLKSETQYKASFIMAFISQIFVVFGYYYTVLCLFDKFDSIKGFTLYEVLLTFGIVNFGFAFCETFARGFDVFDEFIIDGSFDKLLLRPRSLFLQTCCERFHFVKISRLIQSVAVIIIAVIKIDITWNIQKIITLLLMLLSAIVIFLSIFIMMAAYCFYTVKGLEVRNVLTDGCRNMAQYPIGIFSKGFVAFFTFIIPFGFVNYYPLLYLLGKTSNNLYMFSPLLVFIFLLPAIWIFKRGIKRYSSSGS